jgi:hypothetical protein
MIKILICLVIVLLIYCIASKIISSSCGANNNVTIDKLYGIKIKGTQVSRKIGLPTINVKLENPIQCGFYYAYSEFGPATIIVGKNNKQRAYINFLNFKPEIDNITKYEFWNLERVVNTDNEIIKTFNEGCCN